MSEVDLEPETYGSVLLHAARLFRAKGYGGTTAQDISRLLGIRRPSIYYFRAKKEDLLYLICQAAMENAHAAAVQAIAEQSTTFAKVRSLIKAHMETVLPELDYHVVMLRETDRLSEPRHDDIEAMRGEYQQLICTLIRSAQAEGTLRTDIPSKHLTLALLNLLHWPIFWYRPDGELDPAAVGDLVATIFLEGSARQSRA